MSPLVAIDIIVTITFFVVVAAAFVVYAAVFWSIYQDAPFVPSPRSVAEAMMALAEVRAGEQVIDLGSGHGEILFAAARRGASATGYELSRTLGFATWLRALANGTRARVRVKHQDFFLADICRASVITCYLFPKAMAQLKDKCEAELRHPARIVSATFPIVGWQPVQIIQIANRPIFRYNYPQCRQT